MMEILPKPTSNKLCEQAKYDDSDTQVLEDSILQVGNSCQEELPLKGILSDHRVEGTGNGNNGNRIRCYNYRGLGHLARNYIVRPRRRDVAYRDIDEIKDVNANCVLMANLQQASTSGIQIGQAPVYDSDGKSEVLDSHNCYDNEIFNRFTQDEQYTELLDPISNT
ncbi:hypothetical protein Tco_1103430 [Tanacetum coccineum]